MAANAPTAAPQTPTATNAAPSTGAAAPVLPEAPFSATVKVRSPRGFVWLVTARSSSVNVAGLEAVEERLLAAGFEPAEERGAAPVAQGNAPEGEASPMCPTHKTPMKRGKRGWFCPVKLLDDGGDGRPVYCKCTA